MCLTYPKNFPSVMGCLALAYLLVRTLHTNMYLGMTLADCLDTNTKYHGLSHDGARSP